MSAARKSRHGRFPGDLRLSPAIVIVFVIVVVLVIVATLAFSHQRRKQLQHAYARVARQRGGKVVEGGVFSRPMIVFSHREANVVLDVYSTGGKHPTYYTQLHFDWPDNFLRCEVYPEGFFNRLGKLLGMTDLEIGSPNFDATYIITGNSAARIQDLLTPGVQIAIESLRHFLGNGDIYVAFRGGELLVKKKSYLRDYGLLQQFITQGIELYEQASAAGCEGIDFVDEGRIDDGAVRLAGKAAEPPNCQVCGDAITDQMVICRSCRTPHHRECWKYYGACSTYGCGQKTFRAGK